MSQRFIQRASTREGDETMNGETGSSGQVDAREKLPQVHVFESPGSTEFGFTCDSSGRNLPAPKGGPWKHWRTVDIGPAAEREVGVDPELIASNIRSQGFYVSTITDMPTI
jgi:hypothetical protein